MYQSTDRPSKWTISLSEKYISKSFVFVSMAVCVCMTQINNRNAINFSCTQSVWLIMVSNSWCSILYSIFLLCFFHWYRFIFQRCWSDRNWCTWMVWVVNTLAYQCHFQHKFYRIDDLIYFFWRLLFDWFCFFLGFFSIEHFRLCHFHLHFSLFASFIRSVSSDFVLVISRSFSPSTRRNLMQSIELFWFATHFAAIFADFSIKNRKPKLNNTTKLLNCTIVLDKCESTKEKMSGKINWTSHLRLQSHSLHYYITGFFRTL